MSPQHGTSSPGLGAPPVHAVVPSVVLRGVDVDAGLVHVVDFLNARGARTLFSCEGYPGVLPSAPDRATARRSPARLMFADPASWELGMRLLSALADEAGLSTLAARIMGVCWLDRPDGTRSLHTDTGPAAWVSTLRRRPLDLPAYPAGLDAPLPARVMTWFSHEDAVQLNSLALLGA